MQACRVLSMCVCVCTVAIAMCLHTVFYGCSKRTFHDGKSCTWKTICNHNKDLGWPPEMLTVAGFLTPISVYIKCVCAVPLFYIQIDKDSIPGSLWSRLSTKGCWLWHGREWLENTQDPTLRRDSTDCHKPTVPIPTHIVSHLQVSNNLAAHLQPAAPGRALGSRDDGLHCPGAASAAHTCVLSLLPPPQGSAATNPPVQLPYIPLLGEGIL